MSAENRPLSPFMIYRFRWTMVLSISHRLTGVALAVGSPALVCWLAALSMGKAEYESATAVFGSIPGQVFLVLWSFAFFYHLCNGIRHLVWDTGRWLELGPAKASGYLAVAVALALTVATWLWVYGILGGAA